MPGILGKKVGMTQLFDERGQVVPVTIVEAGPCVIVQRKTTETDGYDAIQVGLVERQAPRKVTEPRRGHFKKAGVAPTRLVREFRVSADDAGQAGDEVKVSVFSADDYVDVVGTSKGKGFQGVMRRHGFGGGRASHGSMFHRAPGSIGQSADPSRVFPGLRLPGRMGGKRRTVKNLRVFKVDENENLLFLKGTVPGARNSYVAIQTAKRG